MGDLLTANQIALVSAAISLGALVVNALIVLAAVWQERISRRVTRANLVVSCSLEENDVLLLSAPVPNGRNVLLWQLRLRIENTASWTARSTEVFLARLERYEESGRLIECTSFIPSRLVWSETSQGARGEAVLHSEFNVPGGSRRWCNLLKIVDPSARRTPSFDWVDLSFDVSTISHAGNHVVPAGGYVATIELKAENSVKLTRYVAITLNPHGWTQMRFELPNLVDARVLETKPLQIVKLSRPASIPPGDDRLPHMPKRATYS